MNELLIFFETVSSEFKTLIPVSFILVKAPLKLTFWYNVKMRRRISFNIQHFLY